MLINYLIEKSKNENVGETNFNQVKSKPEKTKRIRVNDKTATGGWF